MSDGLPLLFALCVLGGFTLLIWSWVERRRRNWLIGISEVPLAEVEFGRTVAVNAVADAPALLISPVTQTPCVFYEKQVDIQYTNRPHAKDVGDPVAMGLNLAEKLVWARESVEHVGGFFLVDGATKAFVLPRGAKIRIDSDNQKSTQDPNLWATRRITERFIPRGQTVSVVGRPRTVEELLDVVRQDASLAPETLQKLMEAGSLTCFFEDGGGIFMVADRAYSDIKADTAESADTLFWTGLAMLGLGGFIAVVMILTILKII